MNIKHSIGLNLSADAIPGRLHMVRGDANSRTIVATLWDGAQLYSIPAEAAVMVRFRKPDGTGGLYDATESGSKVSYAGSIVTAPVATQMLAVAGDVFAEIDIFGSSSGAAAERLATFRFVVEVAPCVLPDAQIISSDYYNVLAADIADAKAAADQAKAYAAAAKQSADSAAVSVEGAVKYNTPQTLTDSQKQQARDNIGAPAPYTAGENISISGSVIATKVFPCNPNLLDNWYFGNPVNQRGQAEYTGSGGGNIYCIDRWAVQFDGTKYTVATATLSNISGANVGQMNCLTPNNKAAPFVGRQMTLSLLVDNPDGVDVTLNVRDRTRWSHLLPPKTGSGSLITTTGVFGTLNDGEDIQVSFVVPQGKAVNLIAAKLELGSQQTLAHQENGVWVLNEIPKFGEQLAACQLYYQVYTTAAARPAKALDCRPVMRTDPVQSTVSVGGATLYANSAEL